MNKRLVPYFVFGAGFYTGAVATTLVYAKVMEEVNKKTEKARTISKLIFDLDKWIWQTIGQPEEVEDTEEWTKELKDKLDYIEMVAALYYMED